MKFSNGCWLEQEGCECFAPQQAYFTKVEKDKVIICAPTSRIHNRGCTLDGINLTLVITSPMEEVLRVQTYHHLGAVVQEPAFEILETTIPLHINEKNDHIIITSGSLALEIGKNDWYMKYTRNGKLITESKGHDLALMKTDWKGFAYDKGDHTDTYMRQQLSIGVGELIYGLGERFTPFAKNGHSVDIWNTDGETTTEQSYKNIPFYVSNKGYGVFVNHPEKVSFKVGPEMVSRTAFSVKGTYLDYFLINGPSMKEVLVRYTDITGKPSLPAPWIFGLWLSTSFTTNYDEETVDVVRHFTRLKAKLIPYIYQTAIHASKTGIPAMRSMVLEYTNDKNCQHLDKQYMFGDSLLVAPIFNEESRAEYYLPKGIWTNFFTGKEYKGGTWIEETHSYLSIPLMVRENSIVAIGAHDNRQDYDYANGCELRVYALHDGAKADTIIYGTENVPELTASVKRQGHTILVTSDGNKPYTIRMVNLHVATAMNGLIVIDGNDSIIAPDKGANVIELTF